MTDAWFSAEVAPWFSMISLLSLMAYLQKWAELGRRRTLVMRAYVAATVFGVLLLLGGILAVAVGQPDYVMYTLILSGSLTAGLFGMTVVRIRGLYQKAELHRTIANDL